MGLDQHTENQNETGPDQFHRSGLDLGLIGLSLVQTEVVVP